MSHGYKEATIVTVDNFPEEQDISGTVAISNFPATQPVSGSVSVSNLPATQQVAGSVSVSNLPATQQVSGSVSVSNFPALQATRTINTLLQVEFDEIQASYPSNIEEIYLYKLEGSLVSTVQVTYTDSSKNLIASVVRS